MSIKGVLFDFDGTLANTTDLIIKSFRVTLQEKLRMTVTDEDITRYFGLPLRDCMAHFKSERADELTAFYKEYNNGCHDEMIRSFPKVTETLKVLQELKIRIAVVTSKTRAMTMRGLCVLKLDSYISDIIAVEDCTKHKPDPQIMILGAQCIDLAPGECLCVGDSPYDLLSGKAAGCTTVAVSWSKVEPQLFRSYIIPDYTITEMTDLLKIIKEINRERC